ncbi:cyclic pyranopterin monophosphate synthase MoaC [Nannocystis bainbridge]|uniref:Cyclic pyranopterin monophosphate synthase n=1 Tax=Nannocystis bainbridge TaxID=2995303 RepID=A0ABT5DZ17_9BACT|nr:cyclic pyranopterin monophosphate synthase MoaC [Nannocystis bainbridge]MDC0718819.1 cyclic pyranopterin monophosphate synthase MoaC [Nannocystis bainbridge]
MAEPLTHFDPSGAARMVAVTDKPETARAAVAEARVRMAPATLERIREGQIGKGDVLSVARLAAIGGAKQTPQMIPLCHPVRLTGIDVDFVLEPDLPGVRVTVRVSAVDRTGPEMEAMTAAAAAALTIYDMCKAIDRGMVIASVYLVEKSGGKSGVWTRGGGA